MTGNTTAARAKTVKPFSSETSTADRPMRDGTETVREFAQQGADYSKDMYEKTKATAEETNKVLQQTFATVAKGAAEFNLQWIEMVRINANSTFDFARQLVGVKSPSEFLQLSAAHSREQLKTFAEQAQHLTGLAQKLTADAVQPVQAGVKSAFDKAA